jgi:hypothetical protein
MKSLIVFAGVALARPVFADSTALEASEIQRHLKPLTAEIGDCYKRATQNVRGVGKLELTLVIRSDGDVEDIEVATPGLPARTAKKIDGCIRAAVADLTFPARRGETTAILPFFFQRT